MEFEVSEEPISRLPELAQISIAFTVERTFELMEGKDGGLGMTLSERELDVPYTKDYDAIEGQGPTRWAERFDLSTWGLIVAKSDARWIGGAVVAFQTPGVHMLEGRSDLAVLWDFRVAPEARATGVGTAMFRAAEDWAQSRGCTELKVETQNTNVAACHFYQKQGYTLGAINRFAYTELPHEIQLIWRKDLLRS